MSTHRVHHMFLFGILFTSISIHQTDSEQFTFCFIQNAIYTESNEIASVIASEDDNVNITLLNRTGLREINIARKDGYLLTKHNTMSRLFKTGIENKGLRIITEGTTSILCVDTAGYVSGDMFTPFPDSSLGTDHVALTFCRNGAHCIIAIVGVANGLTNVSVVFPSTFKGVVVFNGQTYTATDQLHLTLSNLQTFQLLSTADLSGVMVRSNKRISVFVGADRTKLFYRGSNHLVEALPPISSWGKQYIFKGRSSDLVRIVSSKNNTYVNITICDKTYKFDLSATYDKLSLRMFCSCWHITANHHILVAQFITGTTYNRSPSLHFPTPVTSFRKSYVVSPPRRFNTQCHVGLVAKMNDLADIAAHFTNQSVSWINVSFTDFAVTTIKLQSHKTMTVSSRYEPFGGHLFCQFGDITASTRLVPSDSEAKFPMVTIQQAQTDTASANAILKNCSDACCKRQKGPQNLTLEDIKAVVHELKQTLYVKKTVTSAWKRKLSSAIDKRPSSQGIGLVASLLLASVVGSIILVDIVNFLSGRNRLCAKGSKQSLS